LVSDSTASATTKKLVMIEALKRTANKNVHLPPLPPVSKYQADSALVASPARNIKMSSALISVLTLTRASIFLFLISGHCDFLAGGVRVRDHTYFCYH
jgi:hypothetical protein